MKINLVNIIPQRFSNETNFDAEPSITVNPTNPNQIIITSFTHDIDPRLDKVKAPIFYSIDAGLTWEANSVIPNGIPGDISVRFGGKSGVLYGAIINGIDSSLNVLRTSDFTAPNSMELLLSVPSRNGLFIDQPWLETTADNGKDVVCLCGNDLRQFNGKTAFIVVSLDSSTTLPPSGFNAFNYIEKRQTAGQNLPSIRTAMHSSGIIYGAFFSKKSEDAQGNTINDIVVVRDDNWAKGSNAFQNLVDSEDGIPGQRIMRDVTIAQIGSLLGTQRLGSNLSIALDPSNPKNIYAFWGDGKNTVSSPYTLHVRRSNDAGLTWTGDLFSISNAINPCIAINDNSFVGLLYQESINRNGNNRWRTHFVYSKDHFNTPANDTILADVLDVRNPDRHMRVTIGDYCNLISFKNDFYGVFSAYNEPDLANFPSDVTYLRNHDFNTKKLLDVSKTRSIPLSVDPFFVHCQIDQ